MTTIYVFSDSHGRIESMKNEILTATPDIVLHLGDYSSDCEKLRKSFPKLDVRGVCGNCDFNQNAAKTLKLSIDGKNILMTHGHLYYVKNGYDLIKRAALEAGADILLFGHTHKAYMEKMPMLDIMNPGSIGLSEHPSYGIISICSNSAKMEIKYL